MGNSQHSIRTVMHGTVRVCLTWPIRQHVSQHCTITSWQGYANPTPVTGFASQHSKSVTWVGRLPGMLTAAPDRTDTRSGFLASPNLDCVASSVAFRASSTCCHTASDRLPPGRPSRSPRAGASNTSSTLVPAVCSLVQEGAVMKTQVTKTCIVIRRVQENAAMLFWKLQVLAKFTSAGGAKVVNLSPKMFLQHLPGQEEQNCNPESIQSHALLDSWTAETLFDYLTFGSASAMDHVEGLKMRLSARPSELVAYVARLVWMLTSSD